MRFLTLIPALVLSASAYATNDVSIACTTQDGGKTYPEFNLTLRKGAVIDLTVEEYAIIKNGVQQENNDIGSQVFDVKVGKPSVTDNGVIKLSVSLQDYSDMLSWDITVAPDSKEAAVVDGLMTSDGDDKNHVSAISVTCQ
jgi:hypothetical protein